ncbi:MAG: tRNA (adenosine(37)-N6)-dimethylallyltransferase MiaA [Candidatus Sungbacteria bacterium RIFCSPLOWO2_02_FULL_54_10]|uniref:tRNA dimethylallyltransferase n=2 Tax=Candidatus Sungiibacteriota TaxID=1817917 RepID=A0A1G2L8F6_9BACT|nr:MAG: tRNA (adenosine(37)-N6)-dimethylallyltransferase MiaA [Candidatus Sungbacteria bacterium RIFCSPHIGHO2_01_FULL_54_26]OHA03294.1 MAG: tRNA (adenosine(37)-N6)-dimethylallyltransferase MiaA [Candidatus Sungbacteria bacterium RIFCSPHIGHO2_02_FULL_53_17]OHA07111.1 MAG: tRNA (adenosine(37)-N6)-dimethylallyltransferase MiaA [Candidatus Sungbacteria bacterium RIFCSPLOWO2_01_FULL_54_21]OHA12342.1 MAG: tRNA (adenosine(37)-N6)-dimethylallyltransferase MiaA [Candidatus Sungbacteria bacterium RIFCSPLO
MQKIIVIVGPTASGKSALAVLLAKKFNGEVVSADSRQVYRGLEIGSAAITDREMRGVPHHLVGIVSPREVCTTGHFVAAARDAIADIARRGRVPIVAGGTAFWVNALAQGIVLPEIKPDTALRRRLEKKSAAQLFAILKKADPRRAGDIEQQNPRRLIRAIEIARSLGRVPPFVKHRVFNTLWLGLNPAPVLLARRVTARAERMIRDGLAAETRALARSIPIKRVREFGFEYRAALLYNRGELTRKQFAARLVADTLHYAKQQNRWWKRNPAIYWITAPDVARRFGARHKWDNVHAAAISLVKKFLQKSPSRTAKNRLTFRAAPAVRPARPRRLPRPGS